VVVVVVDVVVDVEVDVEVDVLVLVVGPSVDVVAGTGEASIRTGVAVTETPLAPRTQPTRSRCPAISSAPGAPPSPPPVTATTTAAAATARTTTTAPITNRFDRTTFATPTTTSPHQHPPCRRTVTPIG
jgi:hypothetical protein